MRNLLFVFAALIVLAAILGAGRSVSAAAEIAPVSLAARLAKEKMPASPVEWQIWYLQDRAYLRSANSPRTYRREIERLTKALKDLEEHPDYRDPLGFTVYGPQATGRMSLLSAAIAARESSGASYPWKELFGHRLKDETPSRYPEMKRVVRALRGLPMPREAFAGFRVYLLPYSMGDANGYGGNGFAFLAATPAGETLIPNQLEVTLIHEFGHHLQFRYMDRGTPEGRKLWRLFLRIRGIPWRGPGEAGSKAWTTSSEEVFAEDFRVWVGKPVTGSGYFGDIACPEPSPATGRALYNFFETLPRHRAAAAQDPWLDDQAGLAAAGRSFQNLVPAGIIAAALLVYGAKKRPKRPPEDSVKVFL